MNDEKKIYYDKEGHCRIWARVGVDLFVTPEQYQMFKACDSKKATREDYTKATSLLKDIFSKGQYQLNGDTYFPASYYDGPVDCYRFENNTDFDVDPDWMADSRKAPKRKRKEENP